MNKFKDKISDNPVQNAFALEYLLMHGRINLLDKKYYSELVQSIKERDDKRSMIANGFALESLEIAKQMAELEAQDLNEYIYVSVREQKRQEKTR